MIPHGTGKPVANGLYAVEVYFGWKLLEWRDGNWWHQSMSSRWTASEPKQWVGSLPSAKQEYDL